MSRKQGMRYLGIDPGLSATGIAVCTITRGGLVRVDHFEVIRTKSDLPLKERFVLIRTRIRELLAEFSVERVICEAFEVQTWQRPKKSGTAMSKLINEISDEIYCARLPFLLSSPVNKSGYSATAVPKGVRDKLDLLPKTQQPHAFDAYIHTYHQVKKNGR